MDENNLEFMTNNNDKEQIPQNKKRLPKKALLFIVLIILLIGVAVVLALRFGDGLFGGSEVETISNSTLEKILEISELSTLSNTYNAVVKVTDDNTGETKYYIAYEGTVKVGIDFKEISIDVNNEEKTITLTLPDAKVLDSSVNMGTLDYIFIDKKAETEKVSVEAYKKAKDDLKTRAGAEESLLEMAKENAYDAVTALVRPWIEQIDSEYAVTIK